MNVSIQEAVKCPECEELNIVETFHRDVLIFGDIAEEDNERLTYIPAPEVKAVFCQNCDMLFVVEFELSLSHVTRKIVKAEIQVSPDA